MKRNTPTTDFHCMHCDAPVYPHVIRPDPLPSLAFCPECDLTVFAHRNHAPAPTLHPSALEDVDELKRRANSHPINYPESDSFDNLRDLDNTPRKVNP